MNMHTGRVRLARTLALFLLVSFIVAKPGMDVSQLVVTSVTVPKVIGATWPRLQTSLSESLLSGPVGINDDRSQAATGLSAEAVPSIQPQAQDDAKKTYALFLSSVGILLAIALLRLTRTLSLRSPL
jgi:hypothetical protein